MRNRAIASALAAILTLAGLNPGRAWGAPDVRKVEATDVYYVPETQSLFDAKLAALRAARIKAMSDAFGSLISLASDIRIEGGRETVRARGYSEVRGEYLGDTRAPRQRIWYDDTLQTLVIETSVCGRAREYASPSDDITCALTRNDDSATATDAAEFDDGDIMYMRFRAGRSGHLAVFLIDEGGVHTLLPYTRDNRSSTVGIERKRDYVFFSRKAAPDAMADKTDRYVLRTNRSREHNRVCVVFSPNDFSRSASENFVSTGRPQFQSYDDFDSWLFGARSKDTQMAVIYKDIYINKRPDKQTVK